MQKSIDSKDKEIFFLKKDTKYTKSKEFEVI